MCGRKMTIHVVFYCAGTAASLSLPESARRGRREGKTLRRRVLFGFFGAFVFYDFLYFSAFSVACFQDVL